MIIVVDKGLKLTSRKRGHTTLKLTAEQLTAREIEIEKLWRIIVTKKIVRENIH